MLKLLLAILALCPILNANEQEASREKLLTLLSGEWISRGLYTAAKLDIADHLQSGPKSVEELAQLTSSNPESLQRLLHMLAGLHIFEEVSPGVFSITPTSQLLTKSNPDSLHELTLFYGEEIHKSWEELVASVQSGTPSFQLFYKQPVFAYFKDNPGRAAIFQAAMKEKSKAAIQSSITAYNFGQFSTVYDIGGGYGQFMQALLNRHPHLNGAIFELPEVIAKISSSNPRCKLIEGDFFTSVPTGADAYLMKSVLHDWDDAKSEQILKNCHQAMTQDSRLIIVDIVLQPDNQYANCMDLLMMAVTGGKERSLASFNQMLENSGFVLEKVYPTSTEFCVLEARKKS